VYWNTSGALPLPEAYKAVRFVLPTTRVILGVPLEVSTMTDSLKMAVTETLSPAFNRLFCTPEALLIDTLFTVGAVVSMVNELIFNVTLLFVLSVTVIVQFEKVSSLKVLKVIVLFPIVAVVVPDEQEPPYVIVPAIEDENI
jgi:hypothetical protein